jgi:hypothetical protein
VRSSGWRLDALQWSTKGVSINALDKIPDKSEKSDMRISRPNIDVSKLLYPFTPASTHLHPLRSTQPPTSTAKAAS